MNRWRGLDQSLILTGLTALGMVLAILAFWPLRGAAADPARIMGLTLVYAAGGLPAALRASGALWRDRVLDIDLLMVVAAMAAAAWDL